MALINEMFDEGDIMMLIDENYDDETNSYNDSSLVEEAAVDVEMDGDPDIDEDIYAGEGEDDFLDVSDQMAMQLVDAEKNWAEKEIDDEVMDMIIDDEDDSIPENRTLGSKTKEYDDIIESIVGLGYERRLAREKVMKYVKEHEKELSPLTHQEKEDRILMAVMRGY